MVESRSGPEKDVKAPNVFDRANEEIMAVFHLEKHPNHHHKETHGLRSDLNEDTSVSDVKAPNAFERAKEEIEAIVETIHPKKESNSYRSSSHGEKRNAGSVDHLESKKPELPSEKDVKGPNLFEWAKEEIESLMHKGESPHHHYKETHGMSDDIDESTPIRLLQMIDFVASIMPLFVFFHGFLELHIMKHRMASTGGDDEGICGSIKLWEDMERVKQNLVSLTVATDFLMDGSGKFSVKIGLDLMDPFSHIFPPSASILAFGYEQ
ncbi:unnamed protein product [Fraxinus pennsylvanica]|uniref:Uncharacterized protein n=1 Tax=Fraxinus pennsylvanica TaxID=56036 RepID=A0AAD1YNN9_9LAMI|nr:unnamed protein product [Fraxinus pennsylvanica]